MKSERFEMRLDTASLKRLDNWRAKQPDVPSRSEAIRRLMDAGMESQGGKKLKLRPADRMVILMLCDLYHHLKIERNFDPEFVEQALFDGHTWALEWQYTGVFNITEDSSTAVDEVATILRVWWSVELAYADLSKADQDYVATELGNSEPPVFPGFDGNEESEQLGIAEFLVNNLGRFSHFAGRDLNSHWPLISEYRRMVTEFGKHQQDLRGGRLLDAPQLIAILKARDSAGRGKSFEV